MIGDLGWMWGFGWVFIALFCLLFVLGVVAETMHDEGLETRDGTDQDRIHLGRDLV